MKHPRILFGITIVAGFVGIAGVSKTNISAAINASPSVGIVRNNALNSAVWPGDFNGDGITDLAAAASTGGVAIALGKGDGTFNAPIFSGFSDDRVFAVGDFNKDGKLDLVTHDAGLGLVVLVGSGNGNFNAGRVVSGSLTDLTNALVADLDGDGSLDIVAITDGTTYVYPGHGDFTFGTPTRLTTGVEPHDGIIADLNGDGRKDIAIANAQSNSLSIFLNIGALNFTAADFPLDDGAYDVAAADLNGDGKMDLVVAVAHLVLGGVDSWDDGFAYVLLGNGDGSFRQPIKYRTAPGAWQIVVGDFTRDGIIDIATANRSAIYRDDCTISLKTWDTVSILPGNGNGTFGTASSFSLGDQTQLRNDRFRNTVVSLNTSDLNGDGATDLIASWGAIVKNNPTDPNWTPKVTASSTQPSSTDHEIVLTAPASDSDQDMLTYSWTDSGGSPIPPVPIYCFTPITFGVHTFSVTVDDQHGHTATSSVTVDFGSGSGTPPTVNITAPAAGEVVPAATPYQIRWTATAGSTPIDHLDVEFSTDDGAHYAFVPGCSSLPATATSCQWNDPDPPTETARIFILATAASGGPSGSATSGRFSIRIGTSGGGALPSPWQQTDVGAVAAAGSATASNGVFSVKGSGADIWGTADEFHFVYQQLPLQFEAVARVDSLQNTNAWAKAGLMVRTSLDANAPQASIFVTPGKGVVFQRRLSTGATSINTQGPALTAPIWLRLTGYNGNGRVWAYYRKNITDPWTFLGSDVLTNYTAAHVGLAVTSHADGTLATAAFSNVRAAAEPTWTAYAGGGSWDGTLFTLGDNGSDIWSVADDYSFVATPFTGDGTLVARVTRLDNTSAWAKAGVMIRETSASNSKHVFAMVTPGHGVNFQYRPTTGGQSLTEGTVPGAAPGWLRIVRSGDVFTGGWSTDGVTFASLGSITVSMNSSVLVGIAHTSHNTSQIGHAFFDDLGVRP